MSWPLEGDTDIDVFETGGGVDVITSGRGGRGREPRRISTGAGRDTIWYGGTAAGALLDNGPDRDSLTWSSHGPASSSSTTSLAGPASAADGALLDAVDGFSMRVSRRATSPSSAPTRTKTSLSTAPSATWPRPQRLHGWRRRQRPPRELPSRSVDLGEGYDSLTYLACHRAYVSLAVSAECLQRRCRAVHSPRGDRVLPRPDGRRSHRRGELTAPIASRPCRRTSWSAAVAAPTTCSPWGPDHAGHRRPRRRPDQGRRPRGVILNGGRGADVLRGDSGPDQLRGDLGRDVAWGQQGKDECKTEVRHGCE